MEQLSSILTVLIPAAGAVLMAALLVWAMFSKDASDDPPTRFGQALLAATFIGLLSSGALNVLEVVA